MIKTIVTMLALCLVLACGTECPEPPDCPECPPAVECDSCCEACPECPECPEPEPEGPSCGDLKGNYCSHDGNCPEGYAVLDVTWDCNPCCKKLADADPKNYIKLSVGIKIINAVRTDSRTDIYVGIWTSYRNLRDAANLCPALIEPTFSVSAGELHVIANEGLYLLNSFENHWQEKLSTENRRAAEYPEFVGRSNTRKEYWQPFEARLKVQNAQVTTLTDIAQADPIRAICGYDNLAGWCGCRLKN